MQSQGIGKMLLNYAKDKSSKLRLNVYQKNTRAISFYQREGFEIRCSGLDEATGEKDYVMAWQQGYVRFFEQNIFMTFQMIKHCLNGELPGKSLFIKYRLQGRVKPPCFCLVKLLCG